MTRLNCSLLVAVTALVAGATTAVAQQAMTVSGHVTARGGPLEGAHVRVPVLRIDRLTGPDGRYSFVIPSTSVQGQTVTVTASMDDRKTRYLPQSASIALRGGALIQDFDLKVAEAAAPVVSADVVSAAAAATDAGAATARWVDTLGFSNLAGAVSLPSALSGRFAGVSVMTSSVLGGSSAMTYRGPKSLLSSAQPVFVVDGVLLDNTVFTSAAQRFGLGGFDYGSPIQDLDVENIESVRFLSGASAVSAFGGRAANGVFLVTTKRGMNTGAFAISASQQVTSEGKSFLPEFQNQYGQGLNGKFEFFDGRGGGINDNVDQNWGPPLDGRPLPQASYLEPNRPDVRFFAPRPDNVRSFFNVGKTLNTTVGLQGSGDAGSFRIFGANRDTRGITPANSLVRRDGGGHVTWHAAPRFTIDANASIDETKNEGAPGTGYNESNPFSQFTRLGRQVDTDSLRRHLRTLTGAQLSWDYAGQNNPYIASLVNSNHSTRTHGFGGASATYALAPWLSATARGGIDNYSDTRQFSIASGWQGGFPFFAAPGDFSKGGSESDDISAQQTSAGLRFDGARPLANHVRWTFGFGGDFRNLDQHVRTAGIDSAADLPSVGAPPTASVPQPVSWDGHEQTSALFGETGFAFSDVGTVRASLRGEWTSLSGAQSNAQLYPALNATVDLLRAFANGQPKKSSSMGATLHGAWYQTGSELTPYAVQSLYAGRAPTGSIAPIGSALLVPDANLHPEVTNGLELGTDLSFLSQRATLGLSVYSERTSDVILPVTVGVGTAPVGRNAGQITNSGVEAEGTIRFGNGETGFGLTLAGNIAKNSNQVDQLYNGAQTIALGPAQSGINVVAAPGQPLGVLLGRKYLRDRATGALLLQGGVPLPDSSAGLQQLGTSQPDWIVGFRTGFRYRWLTADFLVDGRLGGDIYSLTKLWGDYAGSLAETAFRPDTGLLISGIDATTGRANTTHASVQDYYHALGAIQEPWIYSASYVKLREARVSVAIPMRGLSLPFESASLSLIGRNLYRWTKNKDIDPETVLSPSAYTGIEMGQLPTARSIGLQISVNP